MQSRIVQLGDDLLAPVGAAVAHDADFEVGEVLIEHAAQCATQRGFAVKRGADDGDERIIRSVRHHQLVGSSKSNGIKSFFGGKRYLSGSA